MLLLCSKLPMAFHPSSTKIKLCGYWPVPVKLGPTPDQIASSSPLSALHCNHLDRFAVSWTWEIGSETWHRLFPSLECSSPDTHLAHAFTFFRSWLKGHLLNDVYSACSPSNDKSTVAIPISPRTSSLLLLVGSKTRSRTLLFWLLSQSFFLTSCFPAG